MRTPSPTALVRVWELALDKPSWYRSLLMLAPAYPEAKLADLGRLTVGRRNICLFGLRQRLFGPDMQAVAPCPACGEKMEFQARVQDFCPEPAPASALPVESPPEFALVSAGLDLGCRCLTGQDLGRMADAGVPAVRNEFARRAVTSVRFSDGAVRPDGGSVGAEPPGPDRLGEDTLYQVAEALAEQDPYSEVLVGLDCSACGHEWNAPFDISTILWAECANFAQRLLGDCHQLAAAYGWREADLLAMTPARRRYYLEKLSS